MNSVIILVRTVFLFLFGVGGEGCCIRAGGQGFGFLYVCIYIYVLEGEGACPTRRRWESTGMGRGLDGRNPPIVIAESLARVAVISMACRQGGGSNGGVSRSGPVLPFCPFLSFWDFPDFP